MSAGMDCTDRYLKCFLKIEDWIVMIDKVGNIWSNFILWLGVENEKFLMDRKEEHI